MGAYKTEECHLFHSSVRLCSRRKRNRVTRREKDPSTDVRSEKRLMTPTCLKYLPWNLCVSLAHVPASFRERQSTEEKWLCTCGIELAIKRLVYLERACGLANQGLSLKSRHDVSTLSHSASQVIAGCTFCLFFNQMQLRFTVHGTHYFNILIWSEKMKSTM